MVKAFCQFLILVVLFGCSNKRQFNESVDAMVKSIDAIQSAFAQEDAFPRNADGTVQISPEEFDRILDIKKQALLYAKEVVISDLSKLDPKMPEHVRPATRTGQSDTTCFH